MDLKLNLKKKAKVKEKIQISKSMNNIDQRGKLYFQKKFKTLFICVKIHFYHLLSKLSIFRKKRICLTLVLIRFQLLKLSVYY